VSGATPAQEAIPADVAALGDYEAHARARLDPATWAWLSGGAGDEITLRANRAAWDALRLQPRVLRPLAGSHTRIELLGRTLALPVLLAPVAFQRFVHPHGEVGAALAAAAQGAGFVLSTQASAPLEDVARAALGEAGRGPLWFQLYLQRDRGATLALVQRAEAAGFEALVLTVDAPVGGARDRERRAGFRLPPGISAVNLAPGAHGSADEAAGLDVLLQHAPTWADVKWLRGATRLPLLLKGIAHPQDAREALAAGAAGLIVSNHGGRTLDTAPATAEVLPRIADAIGGAAPILVDGGIRRGTDVLKAVALGARAVLVGRAMQHALAAAGALGVAHAVRLLRDELSIALALTGHTCLDEVTRATLFEAD
jgi:4-hydroxymandelate oxidase